MAGWAVSGMPIKPVGSPPPSASRPRLRDVTAQLKLPGKEPTSAGETQQAIPLGATLKQLLSGLPHPDDGISPREKENEKESDVANGDMRPRSRTPPPAPMLRVPRGSFAQGRQSSMALHSSKSVPDLIHRRMARGTRLHHIVQCRCAVRSWVQRQWMRSRGKEVERKVSEEELFQYKQMFAMLDLDGSGTLDVEELHTAMRFIGMRVPINELRERISVFDVSRDGEIDMAEFTQLMARGTFEAFDMSLHERHDDTIVTKTPVCLRNKPDGDGTNTSPSKKGKNTKKKAELPMSDLPFFLWIPAYHRRKTMAALMKGNVVPDLEKLGGDSFAPYEHITDKRAGELVTERAGALQAMSALPMRHRPVAVRHWPRLAAQKPHVAYKPPVGLPKIFSKAKPKGLVRSETKKRIGNYRPANERRGQQQRQQHVRVEPGVAHHRIDVDSC